MTNQITVSLLAVIFTATLITVAAVMVALVVHKRKMHIWLPSYITARFRKRTSCSVLPIHILFCIVDHYEPGNGGVGKPVWFNRVDEWGRRYPAMAEKFKDADGFHPRYTWFYPPHYYEKDILKSLVHLCRQGYGEVEMHLHHNRMEPFPDTRNTLKEKIKKCIEDYSELGIFKTTIAGRSALRYAFIHGDWALDNSRHDTSFCGVDDEISVLLETGCYADFTFPAYMMESQPSIVNSIYYAKNNYETPKSHDIGRPVVAGQSGNEGLMIIQGPMGIRWKDRKKGLIPSIEDADISSKNPPTEKRIDFWIKTAVHIKNRPEWIIVKVHTHGAPESEHETLLGVTAEKMHEYLGTAYNDGKNYKLHYVTARELYNIIKAAESGMKGDPGKYRDFHISPYLYGQVPEKQRTS